jgi:hypothetical protein
VFGRSSLFNRALAACGNLRARHPDNVTIKAIISQLQYLMDLDSGRTRDRSRLDTIVIGVLARCEIEHLDARTARLLERVAEEACRMETPTAGGFANLRAAIARPPRPDVAADARAPEER